MNSVINKRFGPYEILEKLGSGAMGVVFKARFAPLADVPAVEGMVNLAVNDIVALKIANWMVIHEPILGQRFENEYKVTHHLLHPNLVRALRFGVENQLPYLVLEYVAGRSLDKLLEERGPMPVDDALRLFGGVAQAVRFIHENNLVHRDIKPGNILISDAGEAKLADLGLLKNMETESYLTHSRVGLGTLGFSAPEQFDDAKHVDHRCDIYGLAATLYFALSGKFPFGTGSPMQVMQRKLQHLLVPLSQLLPGVSSSLDQTVIRSLHPDPAVRPARIEQFLAGIRGKEWTQAVTIPKPVPSSESIAQNRRTHVRFPVGLPTTLNALSASRMDLRADILDVSAGGLCLRSPERFEPSTVLHVCVPGEYIGIPANYLVRARWVVELPEPAWLLGCSFLRPLENEDLDRFLYIDQKKTGAVGWA